MKTQLILFILMGILITPIAYAQKSTVGILAFTHVAEASDVQTTNAIQESVTNAFVKTKRFNIVDRAKMDALKSEKELQKSEDFMDGSVVAQSASLGADYLVSGHVISAQAEMMTFDDGSTSYKAKFSINLKVIDVATSQVVTSENISPKAGSLLAGASGMGPKTPAKAISKALKDIEKDIDQFVSNNFPLTGKIAEMTSDSELLLALGSQYGVSKKDKFKVVAVSVMEVDGKPLTRKKQIGVIVVSAVEDENFSKCKIKDGGSTILSKFNSGAKLECISIK